MGSTGDRAEGSPGGPGQYQPPPLHHIAPSISETDTQSAQWPAPLKGAADHGSGLVGVRAEWSPVRSLCVLWDILRRCLLVYEQSPTTGRQECGREKRGKQVALTSHHGR